MESARIVKTGGMQYNYLETAEGSHSGLVRAPAKRLPWVTGVEGSNPSPSAIKKMSEKASIITLDPDNYQEYGCPCFLNPKNEGHIGKLGWLKDRLPEGLTVKHIYLEGENKSAGFIEYVPGEYAWRGIHAPGYMVIHCLFILKKGSKQTSLCRLNNKRIMSIYWIGQ